ncbi:molecular chaperone DnaJ [Methylomonas sp. LW13]|uniref:J domain-containing protein n=1 Tax=unclassified Methylomonas TaxID=2608980 RepID=UPI00051C8C37|nr:MULTISPECIES: DnaJ domain-containing protein [unclassified Methylomonas]PKD40304.1 molecular chaperone DnaJ [Methylomonas sp. Kb3]QBC29705.1 molecular chaperone DnaJ [Methylomonas sp. LW13]
MISPYRILGVPEQTSDADIKQAYLQRVKDNPPDRDPARFREIQEAFEAIKDQDSRLRHALFAMPRVEFDTLLAQAFGQSATGETMPADDFLKLASTLTIEKSLAQLTKTPS